MMPGDVPVPPITAPETPAGARPDRSRAPGGAATDAPARRPRVPRRVAGATGAGGVWSKPVSELENWKTPILFAGV